MEIPKYNKGNLYSAEIDGEYYYAEFADFISQLLERGHFKDDTERGILAYVNVNGTDALSTKQKYRLEQIIDEFANEECSICGEPIPLNEVLDIDENDGLCSYHKYQMDKND